MGVVATAALLTGCADSSSGVLSNAGAGGVPTEVGKFRNIGSTTQATGSYRIGPGDVLTVKVFQVEDLNRDVAVSDNGTITLPLIGSIMANGRSSPELERAIAGGLRNYMHSPQVSVFVKEYNSQKFTVEGAVKTPGVFPIKGQTTLMQAIALAQGLNQVADSSTIVVFRQAQGQKYAARFNLDDVRSGKSANPQIVKNDIVYVEESGTKRVLENMKSYLVPAAVFLRFVP